MSKFVHQMNFPAIHHSAVLNCIIKALPFLFLVVLWSTTPLAIKLSMIGGLPFALAVFARFLIAASIGVVLLILLRAKFTVNMNLIQVWLVAGLSSGLSMELSYWSLQFVNSGVAAVVIGILPIVTGLLAWGILSDRPSSFELFCTLVAIGGLAYIFFESFKSSDASWLGIVALVGSLISMASGSVMLKRMGRNYSSQIINSGALVVQAIITGTVWILNGSVFPSEAPSLSACLATLYLAVVGSVLAFMVYIKLVQLYRPMVSASIFVITPVTSLLVGHIFNFEPISHRVIVGTFIMIVALGMFLVLQQRRQIKL